MSQFTAQCPCCRSEHDATTKRALAKLTKDWPLYAAAPKLLMIALAFRECMDAADSEHPDFLDSGADVVDKMFDYEVELNLVLGKLKAFISDAPKESPLAAIDEAQATHKPMPK